MPSASKTLVISGTSRGIGAAIAKSFVKQGWQVLGASRSAALPEDLGPNYLHFSGDLSQIDIAKQFINFCHKNSAHGYFDLLVNNAAIAGETPWGSQSFSQWQNIINTNLNSCYYLCEYSLPYLKNHLSRIINIGSVLSHKAVPEQSAYTAAKHGLLGLTRSLALELARRDITVNCICPGWTRTEMMHQRRHELHKSEDELLFDVPLGRFIEPDEIAEMCHFLCSAAAKNITGQSLNICGGVS
ncbi:MAG: SDR family oxidoreductase [Oligoflexales bacterium]|nr:SDR family oxidoreductase [Oligoflexales bacterium]